MVAVKESPDITVDLAEPDAFAAQVSHLEHGGLFVPAPKSPPQPLTVLAIRVLLPGGRAVVLTGRVVQVTPGAGMALALDPSEDLARLVEFASRGARDGSSDGPEPAPEREDDGPGTLHMRIRAMSTAERRNLALKGDRSARMLLMKDSDKNLHTFVIQNPKITLDEIRYIAGYRQTHPDVLKKIAENREWIQNPRIVSAIVCNPKTPSPVALRLVDKMSPHEMRRIAKTEAAPPAVVTVIKRKVTAP